jgi:hypothetical protein
MDSGELRHSLIHCRSSSRLSQHGGKGCLSQCPADAALKRQALQALLNSVCRMALHGQGHAAIDRRMRQVVGQAVFCCKANGRLGIRLHRLKLATQYTVDRHEGSRFDQAGRLRQRLGQLVRLLYLLPGLIGIAEMPQVIGQEAQTGDASRPFFFGVLKILQLFVLLIVTWLDQKCPGKQA